MVSAGLGPQERARLLHVRRARRSQLVDDALTPGGRRRRARATRTVRTVGVVGSGTMATGIIEVFAKAGYDVTYVTRSQPKVAAVTAAVSRSRRRVQRGKLTEEDRDEALGHLTGSTSLDDLATSTSSSRPSSRTWP